MAKLLALFIGVPFIEMLILIKLGEVLGFPQTVLLVVVTGILGAGLARTQGFAVLMRIQDELNSGRMPAKELIDGILILAGGIVLLTPGLLTDLLGFAILIPWTRQIIKKWVQRKIEERVQQNTGTVTIEPD